jgi:hypothetical protein
MNSRRGARDDLEAALNEEFNAERAVPLGRIARQLDEYLATLAELRAEIALGRDRAEEYERVRKLAERWFWYLTVQREVLGFYDNAALARAYPVPGPLPRRK